ncbi:Methionine--tRNA ligase mitochondrial [Taenia solium]|eukprot:TsM_000644900 transcript=TsM_000644900 gene=TsM_000644900
MRETNIPLSYRLQMSKSLGNVVSPVEVLEYFAAAFTAASSTPLNEAEVRAVATDCLRYCLVRSACLNEDTTFSLSLATETVNTELVNWMGNLLSRIISRKIIPTQTVPMLDLAEAQAFMSNVVDAEFLNECLPDTFDALWWEHLQPHHSVDALMKVVRQTNAFVDRHQPWASVAAGDGTVKTVVGVTLEALRLIGCLLTPLIPSVSDRMLLRLGIKPDALRCSSWHLDLNDQCQNRPLKPCEGDMIGLGQWGEGNGMGSVGGGMRRDWMNWRSASFVVFGFVVESSGKRGSSSGSTEGVIETESPAVGIVAEMVYGACFEIASMLARMTSVAGWEAQ